MPPLDLQILAKALAFLEPPLTGEAVIAIVYAAGNPDSRRDADALATEIGSSLNIGEATLTPLVVESVARLWFSAVRRDQANGLGVPPPSQGQAMLGSQRGHAVEWQVCLAHLLRDTRYPLECGDTAFSAPLKRLWLRAIAIGRRRETLKDTTLKQHLVDLDRRPC